MKKTDMHAKRALLMFLALALAAACAIAVTGCSGQAEKADQEAEEQAAGTEQAAEAEQAEKNAQAAPTVEPDDVAGAVEQVEQQAAPSQEPQKDSGSSNNTAGSASASQHSHSWEPVTVHHDAVYEQQWVENIVQKKGYKCGTCGNITYSFNDANAHQEASGRGGCGAYATYYWTEDHGSYQFVCVQEAWDETVGYQCSCGATK